MHIVAGLFAGCGQTPGRKCAESGFPAWGAPNARDPAASRVLLTLETNHPSEWSLGRHRMVAIAASGPRPGGGWRSRLLPRGGARNWNRTATGAASRRGCWSNRRAGRPVPARACAARRGPPPLGAGAQVVEPACKPDSVPPDGSGGGGHPSGTDVAVRLVRPTRRLPGPKPRRDGPPLPPAWPCSGRGLPGRAGRPARR